MDSDSDFQTTTHSEFFNQNEIYEMIRDLNLSKKSFKLATSRAKEKNRFNLEWKLRLIKVEQRTFFIKNSNLMFWHGMGNLLNKADLQSNPRERCPFNDNLKRSIKCIFFFYMTVTNTVIFPLVIPPEKKRNTRPSL